MTNRALVVIVTLTLAYVASGLFAAYRSIASAYGDPGSGRVYSSFIFVWDWWERASPSEVYEDAELVAYVSSVAGYAIFPHDISEHGKWIIRQETVQGRKMAFFRRYNQASLHHYAPFFAEHRERARTILVEDTALLGNMDRPPSSDEVISSALFLARCTMERRWPAWLRFDALAGIRASNRAHIERSRADHFFREFKEVDGVLSDVFLEPRMMIDGIDGLRFEAIPEATRETLRQFVRDGNEVWILSIERSDLIEPRYSQRMARARAAVAELAEHEEGIEYLYFPTMPERFYRDHAHMNPAGSERFHAWLGAQLDARDGGLPLPGTMPAEVLER